MQAYWDAVERLGMQLIALLAEALGLDVEAFLRFFDKPMLHLRPLHYSSVRSAPDQCERWVQQPELIDVSIPIWCSAVQ